jgi:hypothetical protein
MANLQSAVSVAFRARAEGNASVVGQIQAVEFSKSLDFANGVLAKQADVSHVQEYTILSGAFVDIDLNGSLTNAVGVAVNAVKVAAIVITSKATNTTDVTVGGAATNAFVGPFGAATHTIKVAPDGFLAVSAPGLSGVGTVTPATADLLRITNAAGASAVITVAILGRSA